MHLRDGNRTKRTAGGAATIATATVVAVALLVGAGVVYRAFAARWQMSTDKHIELPVPLSNVPRQIGGWVGEELEIEPGTRLYMERHFADDYVSLRYVNATKQLWADAYVVYCASRMAGIVGHQPRICYPGNGWIWDRTTPAQFTTISGRVVHCLVHCFHKPAPAYQEVYVLNFYVLNGRITLSEKDFSGWFGRRPNLAGDPARYVAQVQISSVIERAPGALASQIVDTILAFLPDGDGYVAAAEFLDRSTHAEEATRREK